MGLEKALSLTLPEAEREILRTESALKRYSAAKQASEKRQELRGRMVDAIAPVAAIALPVRSAINFESAMADAAKTIEGMRDEAGNLTPAYYEIETAVKRMGRSLPLTHEELARLFAAGVCAWRGRRRGVARGGLCPK